MKHTKSGLFALAMIAAASLLLVGCTAAAEVQTSNAPEAMLEQTVESEDTTLDRPLADGSGSWANGTERVVAAGAGYRGNGNSGSYGGSEISDDCVPVAGDESAYPVYTPTDSDLTLTLSGYGSAGALNDNSLSLADMLTYAIQDEYAARAEYDAILVSYGSVRPFSNILRAEETHIDALLPLFTEYGISAAADEGAERAALPDDLTSAYQTGVNAEVTNIAMYELFLEQNLPADVRVVFESLMRASENHLRAFQNRL